MSNAHALVHLLSRRDLDDAERSRARALATSADWTAVVREARRCATSGLVRRSVREALGDAIPSAARDELERDYRAVLADNLLRLSLADEVVDRLERAGVGVALLKGILLVETHYGDPGLRPMRDVDLLVPAGARATAHEVLRAMGFERLRTPGRAASEEVSHQAAYSRGRAKVEIHTGICDGARYPVDTHELWRRSVEVSWRGRTVRALAPADHLAYLALHVALHGFLLPLTALVDLATVLRRTPDLAIEAADRARAWRAATAVHRALLLARDLCGAPLTARAEAALRPGRPRSAYLSLCLRGDRMPAFRWGSSLRRAQALTLLPLMDGGRTRYLLRYAALRLRDLLRRPSR